MHDDIGRLLAAIEQQPDNPRHWLNLGQRYQAEAMVAEAAQAFAKSAETSEHPEEAWRARLHRALCLKTLGEEGSFLREALAAFDRCPDRSEPLYEIARFYRERSMNEASVLFCEAGMAIPQPAPVARFVDDFVYTAGLREEYTIAANYSHNPARKSRGHAACNWLALNRHAPGGARDLARANLFYYTGSARSMLPSLTVQPVAFVPPEGYRPTNPSITRSGNSLVMVVRAVNYFMTKDGGYLSADGGPFRTRNFLIRLGTDLSIESTKEILVPLDLPEPSFRDEAAFGDMRLFVWRDELWCTACYRELTAQGWYEQILARIDDGKTDCCQLTDWRVLRPAPPTRDEKNWMPQIVGDQLRFIYSCDPTRIVDEHAQTITERTPDIATELFRGGSQAVEFENGWLMIIHEVIFRDGRRFYEHRFVWFDDAGSLRGVSRRFFLQKRGIEFVAGLAWHPNGAQLLISYGVDDGEAWVASVDADDVCQVIENVQSFRATRSA